ncbi:DUF6444 domain-containing protein [Endozoicomonas sp.]|uniref:DUF6444 domain-containing protein n=1 Tax=Endozoicomonas sp. TaxID=1892382 RepID=UPI00383A73EE
MDQDSSAILLNAALLEENSELRLEVTHLKERCRELEEKVKKNSQNSSKPPSSDGYQIPIKTVIPRKILHPRKILTLHRKSLIPKASDNHLVTKPGGKKGIRVFALNESIPPITLSTTPLNSAIAAKHLFSMLIRSNALNDRYLSQENRASMK